MRAKKDEVPGSERFQSSEKDDRGTAELVCRQERERVDTKVEIVSCGVRL